ncbi:MAG: nitrite/sulfite reductase [bacterium]
MKKKYSVLKEVFDGFLAGAVTPEVLKPVAAPFGIYQQRNGHFMLRVRVSGGEVTCEKLAGIADILDATGGHVHLTTRQDIQLHNVSAAQVLDAVVASDRLGLPFKGGGGNTYRNILVGSDSGLAADAVFDVYPYARALNRAMQKCEKAFALPRKFKIGIFASERDRLRAAVQDLGFIARQRDGQAGFSVFVAGGLGRESSVGFELVAFLPASQIVRATLALIAFYYDHGERANRHQARLRFLLKRLGAEAFQRLYLEYFAQTAASVVAIQAGDLLGALAQGLKRGRVVTPVEGFAWWEQIAVLPTRFGDTVKSVRLFVPYGNLDAEQLRKIAALAKDYGSPAVRLLVTQDILIPLVHGSALAGLYKRLRQELAGIDLTFGSYKGHLVTCVGASVCKIGIADSPAAGDAIAALLDRYLPPNTPEKLTLLKEVADNLRISGCLNACAGHPAAKIGIECSRRREGEVLKTVGVVFAGAGLGEHGEARLAERLPDEPVPLEQLGQKVMELVSQGAHQR